MSRLQGSLFLFGAVVLTAITVNQWHRGRQERRWDRTVGRVTRSGVATDRSQNVGALYDADVEYHYTVTGRSYCGTTVRSGQMRYSWKGPARRQSERYPAGTQATVWFDPARPDRSVLEPGGDPIVLVLTTLFAAGLYVVAALVLNGRLL